MLRSMYSGISGMKNFQSKLDVVGNNIANVNTSGFKKGRITFQDLMSQTSSPAQGSTNNRGGVNPIQVGTGSSIGSIDNVHTQGFKQNTDRPLDLMLEGDGFFVLDTGDNETAYTRSGNFYLDDDGYLVNSNGYFVLDNDENRIEIGLDDNFSIQKDGQIITVNNNGNSETLATIGVATFNNESGLEKAGENLWLESASSGNAVISAADTGVAGSIESGALEMSNVDLSEEFTEMITAQRGFQANTRIITTSDEILQELVNLKR